MNTAYLRILSGKLPGRLGVPKSPDLHEDDPADWMFKYASRSDDGIIDFRYLR
jgi:hypothetical protein